MAIVSMKEAEKGCPYCGKKVQTLYRRFRRDEKRDRTFPSGEYYGCDSKCRALTLSPTTGKFNLAER